MLAINAPLKTLEEPYVLGADGCQYTQMSHNKDLCVVEIADKKYPAGQHLVTLYPSVHSVVLIG